MASPPTRPPVRSAHSSYDGRHVNTEHSHRRHFIGPIPEKVIANLEAQVISPQASKKKRGLFRTQANEASEGDDHVSVIVRQLARNFFLRQGGKEEDWTAMEEEGTREEMMRRWRASEWASTLKRRRKKDQAQQPSRWVGGSFEVGGLLGMNIIQEATDATSKPSAASHANLSSPPPTTAFTSNADTFVTAQSELEPSASDSPHMGARSPHLAVDGSPEQSDTSETPLVRPDILKQQLSETPSQARTEIYRRPIIKSPSLPNSDFVPVGSRVKGKKKHVHYVETPVAVSPRPESPTTVLERSGDEVHGTSAGAMTSSMTEDGEFAYDSIKRDRMYVCVKHSDSVASISYDEDFSRTARNLSHEDWKEFIVVWRADRIELYDDYKFPGTEKFVGHKHLAYIIELNAPETRLTLYSFVDMSFSLTCVPVSLHRFQLFHNDGRNIFVFKHRSRSRASDWLWHLWRYRGGELPNVIEVWNPSLNAKVKFHVPNMDIIDTYRVFSRENVLSACMNNLRQRSDYSDIIERQLADGKVLELAWRVDTSLDWIWLDDTISGDVRKWSVLCGLAIEQTPPAHLELRLGTHFPSWLRSNDGTPLVEPSAIEGYLDRINAATQAKQAVYLVTHNGNLFSISPAHAHPPSPLGLDNKLTGLNDLADFAETLKHSEVERGAEQIRHAYGVTDLRNIVAVRRAFQHVPDHRHSTTELQDSDDQWMSVWSVTEDRTANDEQDEGGDEGMARARASDKADLKLKRSFELLMVSGSVIRFEAYSRKVALEWIERMRELVLYWKARHRVDARDEMDVARVVRSPITPRKHVHLNDEDLPPNPPPDPSLPLPGLGPLYNWCVLEGCKPIVKSGTLFMRRSLRGHYRIVDLVLLRGSLAWFKIRKDSLLHTAAKKKISLGNTYILSGFLATQILPADEFQDQVARRYRDGLETDDDDVDRLFVILHHARKYSAQNSKLPPLKKPRKMIVFRTRSKLERDSWCWALNSEIERIMRTRREYEAELRNRGAIASL